MMLNDSTAVAGSIELTALPEPRALRAGARVLLACSARGLQTAVVDLILFKGQEHHIRYIISTPDFSIRPNEWAGT